MRQLIVWLLALCLIDKLAPIRFLIRQTEIIAMLCKHFNNTTPYLFMIGVIACHHFEGLASEVASL